MAGTCGVDDACQRLNICAQRFHQLRQQIMTSRETHSPPRIFLEIADENRVVSLQSMSFPVPASGGQLLQDPAVKQVVPQLQSHSTNRRKVWASAGPYCPLSQSPAAYVANVRPGFTDLDRRRLAALLQRRGRFRPVVRCPHRGLWLEPDLMCEINYLEWTSAGQRDSMAAGCLLRRFVGVVHDGPGTTAPMILCVSNLGRPWNRLLRAIERELTGIAFVIAKKNSPSSQIAIRAYSQGDIPESCG